MNRRGFTLIELLVSISIIALLIAVMLPSLSQAREAAHSVRCRSNLRQIGLASIMYADDNHGAFPHHSYWANLPASYAPVQYRNDRGLVDYLNLPKTTAEWQAQNDSVLTCPARNSPKPATWNRTYSMSAATSYPEVQRVVNYTIPDAHSALQPSQIAHVMDGIPNVLSGNYWAYREVLHYYHQTQLLFPHNDSHNTAYLDGRVDGLARATMQATYTIDHAYWSYNSTP